MDFKQLGLSDTIITTLAELDYAEPTPIQVEAIPHILNGRDVIGQAQTGTGKTAAFTLPVLQQLDPNDLQMLILTPTRELARQIAESVHRYGKRPGMRVLPIYGMSSYDRQIRRLKKGVNVVVGTPGRTLDLIQKGVLKLGTVRFVVLDEADEMLKMGFIEDVEAILNATNARKRQTSLFSATFSDPIRELAQTYMHDPVHISIEPDEVTVASINQRYYVVKDADKLAALSRILEVEKLKNTLIFARTKVGAAELAERLIERGFPAVAIHGDLPQPERERIIKRFSTGQLSILTATDVVARGVDISDVSHVINYDIPGMPIEYVHRIGRTGRAGREGDAITLVTPRQVRHLRAIEAYVRKPINKAKLPTRQSVLERRDEQFIHTLTAHLDSHEFGDDEYALIDELMDMGYTPEHLLAGMVSLLREHESQRPLEHIKVPQEPRDLDSSEPRGKGKRKPKGSYKRDSNGREPGMVRLSMNIGRANGVRPADVVYTIASSADIPGRSIGAIDIQKHKTYVDVPEASVDAVLRNAQNSRIRGSQIKLAKV